MGNISDRLAEPITTKTTERGVCPAAAAGMVQTNHGINKKKKNGTIPPQLAYAASGMQGWRTSMEDCHTACPELYVPASSSSTSSTRGKKQGNKSSKNMTKMANHALFAVYDGHGGSFTAKYAGEHFLRHFTQQPSWRQYADLPDDDAKRGAPPAIDLLKTALTNTFVELDAELQALHLKRLQTALQTAMKEEEATTTTGTSSSATVTVDPNGAATTPMSPTPAEDEEGEEESVVDDDDEGSVNSDTAISAEEEEDSSMSLQDDARSINNNGFRNNNKTPQEKKNRWGMDRSGTTIVVVLMTPTHFICANAGDSRAVLVRKKSVLPLSFDHKPTDPPEEARIVAAGGKVSIKRVDGDLAVSRGLGDFSFKNRPDLPPDQQKVTCCPEILVEPRQCSQDEFIILACDGIWDVASNESCAKLVHAILDEGETDIGLVCEEMLDTCLERDSRDNMTVAMVTLPAIQMSCSNSNTSTSSSPIANFFKRGNSNSSMNSSHSNDKKVGVWARRAKRQAKQGCASASASGTTHKQTIITTNNKI
eukprot:scaffold1312_cov54-Attheya_sp.AAC.4